MNNEDDSAMKTSIPAKAVSPGRHMQILCFAALTTIFLATGNIHAYDLDECLAEALKYADDSATVGELREQCREETGTGSPGGDTTRTEDRSAADTEVIDESGDLPATPEGPAVMILKTPLARKPAFFPHKKHQDKYACATCHHGKDAAGRMTRFTEETEIFKCTSCHNTSMPNQELNGFQAIGHKLCRECHRKHQDITSARCSTCHRM